MPFEDGPGRSPITLNNDLDIDLLLSNPFADEPGNLSTSAPTAPPVIRRRDSESASKKDSIWFPRHARAQTEDQSSGTWHHPLKNSMNGSVDHAGVTRPHLTRVLSALGSSAASEVHEREDISQEDSVGDMSAEIKEETVLVHEVTSKDSLAGVALKYGISMAELRKVNHLWASDSIHLRKILYIPLDKTSHFKHRTVHVRNQDADSSHSEEHLPHNGETIRIPASQLSFFPPPSKPISALPISSEDSWQLVMAPSRPSAPPPLRTLSSLLTALPIPTAARDTIVARLSLDSSRSSTSDEQEHELDDVRSRAASISTTTPKSRYRRPFRTSITDTDFFSASPPSPSPARPPSLPPEHASPSPSTKSWIHGDESLPTNAVVRTSQMEPSPAMQLPLRSISQVRAKQAQP